MKHLVLIFAASLMAATLTTGCEPEECKEFKELICKHCGADSPACKAVKKRRGRDEKKCKAGVRNVKARVKTEAGKKTLCTLLNDERKKK
jgi:hypothetical protein